MVLRSGGVAWALAWAASCACAQPVVAWRIEPGPLNQVLGRFATAAGVFVAADGALTAGQHSPGLSGSHTPAEALHRLLQGTGLQARRADNGAWVLLPVGGAASDPEAAAFARSAEQALPTLTVQARPESAALPTPVAGSRAAPGPQQLPLSLSVLGREALDLLQAHDVQQALQASPGVSTSNVDSSRYRVYARGFQIDTLQLDGVSTVVGYLTPPNLSMYERVEVLRGPDGVLAGVGSPGGSMNLVRKRPGPEFAATAQLGLGSYDGRSALFDVGGPLNAAASLKGRLVASSDRQALRQDGTFRHDEQLYGVLEAEVAPGASLRAGASRQWLDARSMQYGYPTYTDGRFLQISPATYYGADWNHEAYRQDTAFVEWLQRLGAGDWSVQLSANVLHSQRDSAFAGLRGAVDAHTLRSHYQTSLTRSDDRQQILDAKLTGAVHAAGRRHLLTLGASLLDQQTRSHNAPGDPRLYPVDLGAPPDVVPLPVFGRQQSQQTTHTQQLGVYGQSRLALADALELTAGLRASTWNSSARVTNNAMAQPPRHDRYGLRLTPSAALRWQFAPGRQAYAALGRVFTPQSQRDAFGALLPPLQARQQELGFKQELAHGKALFSAALFRVMQANRAVLAAGDTTGLVYQAQGRARVQGLDAQLSGQPWPGLDLSAGYVRSMVRAQDGHVGRYAFSAFTPAHTFKAWMNWRPGGRMQAWNLGAALKASSAYQVQDGVARIRQPGLYTLDLWAGVRLRPGLELRLHVENLANRRYYQSLSSTADHNFLGNPRKATLTLRARY